MEYEVVAQMKQRMFLADKEGLTHPISDYADELAVKLMIVKAMQNFELPEDKLMELAKQESVLDTLYPLCKRVIAVSYTHLCITLLSSFGLQIEYDRRSDN